jgi:hypothetical protein
MQVLCFFAVSKAAMMVTEMSSGLIIAHSVQNAVDIQE